MAQIEILLPAMGEGIIEATLISWMKKEGDSIQIDENLIEVATDKVNSEVPSTANGILIKKLYNENDVIPVGKAFAIISTDGDEAPATQSEPKPIEVIEKEIEKAIEIVENSVQESPVSIEFSNRSNQIGFLSPLVQSIIKQEQISENELSLIQGTGKEGRITKEDILQFLENRGSKTEQKPANVQNIQANNNNDRIEFATPISAVKNEIAAIPEGGVPMDRMRKLIADHMIKSIQTSAHVSSFIEADVTNMVAWRSKNKDKFKEKYGENLTFTPLLIEAIALAIQEFPVLNSTTDGKSIFYKKDINIGMAAALPDGNLIVPVIKNADMLNIMGLAKKVNDLGNRAKKNQLKPDEIQGGTYTMTNLGSFGNLFGTPIINQPQVAILGVGAIVKKPVVLTVNGQDTIAIRSMMYLSHSYDHRIIDGYVGGMFVKRVAEILEKFDLNRSI
jgi:2-oxoglutarate dehydrogenase E2 component (dihydrolipoamide succinyltransferase)